MNKTSKTGVIMLATGIIINLLLRITGSALTQRPIDGLTLYISGTWLILIPVSILLIVAGAIVWAIGTSKKNNL